MSGSTWLGQAANVPAAVASKMEPIHGLGEAQIRRGRLSSGLLSQGDGCHHDWQAPVRPMIDVLDAAHVPHGDIQLSKAHPVVRVSPAPREQPRSISRAMASRSSSDMVDHLGFRPGPILRRSNRSVSLLTTHTSRVLQNIHPQRLILMEEL